VVILEGVERFIMLEAKPVSTLLLLLISNCPHIYVQLQINAQSKYMSKVKYANTVGCLMYLMACTSHDISHAVSVVSRYMQIQEKILEI
jgi:hypothetical protein